MRLPLTISDALRCGVCKTLSLNVRQVNRRENGRTMRTTPTIPIGFRTWKPSLCPHGHSACRESKNVYEISGLQHETKLFGSERMVDSHGHEVIGQAYKHATVSWEFGDWDCDLLVVMQDAAPWNKIAERVGNHPDPFSARNFIDEPSAGGAATNRELQRFTSPLKCRKLAGSALIGVLRKGIEYSEPIPDLLDCDWINGYCTNVLRWVINRSTTPNLKTIACLGRTAFDFISQVLAISSSDKTTLEQTRGSTIQRDRFRVSYLWHPQPQAWSKVGRESVERAWRQMALESGIPYER